MSNLCCQINPVYKCMKCGYLWCKDCYRHRGQSGCTTCTEAAKLPGLTHMFKDGHYAAFIKEEEKEK